MIITLVLRFIYLLNSFMHFHFKMLSQNLESSFAMQDSTSKEISQYNQIIYEEDPKGVFPDFEMNTFQKKNVLSKECRSALEISTNTDYSRNVGKFKSTISLFITIWLIGLIASQAYLQYQLRFLNRTKWICIYPREMGKKLTELDQLRDTFLNSIINHSGGTSGMWYTISRVETLILALYVAIKPRNA